MKRGAGPRRDGPGARRFASKRAPLPGRTKPMRKVSKRRARENVERRRRLHERYGPNPPCMIRPLLAAARTRDDLAVHEARALYHWTCDGPARDGHEVLTRGRGGSIVDPDNVLPGCGSCHRLVTDHPRLADAIGATTPSWS